VGFEPTEVVKPHALPNSTRYRPPASAMHVSPWSGPRMHASGPPRTPVNETARTRSLGA
jgi:hypothetical protein